MTVTNSTTAQSIADVVAQAIAQQLATSGAAGTSSIQIEGAAKGPPRITVKNYASNPLTQADVDDAIASYGYAFREIERNQMANWAETVESFNLPHLKEMAS
jgi:hypothetical protein